MEAYEVPYRGPFPQDAARHNAVRFTPVQAAAIHSGLNHGLTAVVGPPGTGKTDVAVQIISSLYHSFPQQRILLITHSNNALNDLFEKIMVLGERSLAPLIPQTSTSGTSSASATGRKVLTRTRTFQNGAASTTPSRTA